MLGDACGEGDSIACGQLKGDAMKC
jgi:hypothetical protein